MSTAKKGMKRGYYVKGYFVAEGSELDMELKAEQIGSKTKDKAQNAAKRDFGQRLLALSSRQIAALGVSERLQEALAEAKRLTDFEGKRRQMQFIAKLLRAEDMQALEAALEQGALRDRLGSAADTPTNEPRNEAANAEPAQLAKLWAAHLQQMPAALQQLLAAVPEMDSQQLRSLLRQQAKLQEAARTLQNAQPPMPAQAQAAHQQAQRALQKLTAFLAVHTLPEIV